MASGPKRPARRPSLIEGETLHRVLRTTPPAMSVLALAICALAAAGVASDHPGDEGAMAHLYQLIVVVQLPIICLFAGVVARRRLRDDVAAVGVQVGLLIAALTAVPILGL